MTTFRKKTTKLQRDNDLTWSLIVATMEDDGFSLDRWGNLVKGEKGSRIRYKRKAINIRKEQELVHTGYDGKPVSEWFGLWSYPLSQITVKDGVICRKS